MDKMYDFEDSQSQSSGFSEQPIYDIIKIKEIKGNQSQSSSGLSNHPMFAARTQRLLRSSTKKKQERGQKQVKRAKNREDAKNVNIGTGNNEPFIYAARNFKKFLRRVDYPLSARWNHYKVDAEELRARLEEVMRIYQEHEHGRNHRHWNRFRPCVTTDYEATAQQELQGRQGTAGKGGHCKTGPRRGRLTAEKSMTTKKSSRMVSLLPISTRMLPVRGGNTSHRLDNWPKSREFMQV